MSVQIGDLYRKTSGLGSSGKVVAFITDIEYDRIVGDKVVVYELYGSLEYQGERCVMSQKSFLEYYRPNMSKIQVGDLWRGKKDIQDRNPFISSDDIVLITDIVKIQAKDFFEYTHVSFIILMIHQKSLNGSCKLSPATTRRSLDASRQAR